MNRRVRKMEAVRIKSTTRNTTNSTIKNEMSLLRNRKDKSFPSPIWMIPRSSSTRTNTTAATRTKTACKIKRESANNNGKIGMRRIKKWLTSARRISSRRPSKIWRRPTNGSCSCARRYPLFYAEWKKNGRYLKTENGATALSHIHQHPLQRDHFWVLDHHSWSNRESLLSS